MSFHSCLIFVLTVEIIAGNNCPVDYNRIALPPGLVWKTLVNGAKDLVTGFGIGYSHNIGRAPHKDSLIPSCIVDTNKLLVPYEGKIYKKHKFEVLVQKFGVSSSDFNFEYASGGHIPAGAVPGGWDSENCEPLYIGYARGHKFGGVSKTKGKLSYNHNGEERSADEYYVLVSKKLKITSYELLDVHYDIDQLKLASSRPTQLGTTYLTNRGDREQLASTTNTVRMDSSSTWDNVFGVTAGVSTEIKAGIPFLAESKVAVSLETSYSHSWGGSVKTSKTVQVQAKATVPPHSQIKVTIRATKSVMEVPYSATMKQYSQGKLISAKAVNGVFKGVQVYQHYVEYGPARPLNPSDITTSPSIDHETSRITRSGCFEYDVDYGQEPFDGGLLGTASAEDCQMKCKNDDRCKVWSWRTADSPDRARQCHLKSTRGAYLKKSHVVSGPKKCSKIEKPTIPGCYEDDVDYGQESFDGGEHDTSTPEACHQKCKEDVRCRFWSWTTADFPDKPEKCHLKRGKGAWLHKPNVISGPKRCTESEIDSCFQENVNYGSSSLPHVSLEPSAEECQRTCRFDDRCNFWTWKVDYAQENAKQCLLKTKRGIRTNQDEVISGPKECGDLFLCYKRNFNAIGGHLIEKEFWAPSAEVCQRKCQLSGYCEVWSWAKSGSTCSLRRNAGEFVSKGNVISGPKICEKKDNFRLWGCIWFQSDIF